MAMREEFNKPGLRAQSPGAALAPSVAQAGSGSAARALAAIARRDEVRGHFVLDLAPDVRFAREVIAVDLGPVLHVQTRGAHLTPAEAREFAEALTWWAERKEAHSA